MQTLKGPCFELLSNILGGPFAHLFLLGLLSQISSLVGCWLPSIYAKAKVHPEAASCFRNHGPGCCSDFLVEASSSTCLLTWLASSILFACRRAQEPQAVCTGDPKMLLRLVELWTCLHTCMHTYIRTYRCIPSIYIIYPYTYNSVYSYTPNIAESQVEAVT